jgi:uncharacterized protein YggE
MQGAAIGLVALLGTLAATAGVVSSQAPMEQHQAPTPQIVTNATEEVEIMPDRAVISFSVETRGKTAAEAGRENARIQGGVLDTLRKLGIAPAQLRTQGLNINPEYEYPQDGRRPTVVGYQARNSVQVEVRQLAQAGTLIDAGLAKGATNVGGLRFFASNTEGARREALQKAVTRARADAEAIASAAGGALGGVLEIQANPGSDGPIGIDAGPMMLMKEARADAPTQVESGVLKVRVSIMARFAYVSR